MEIWGFYGSGGKDSCIIAVRDWLVMGDERDWGCCDNGDEGLWFLGEESGGNENENGSGICGGGGCKIRGEKIREREHSG